MKQVPDVAAQAIGARMHFLAGRDLHMVGSAIPGGFAGALRRVAGVHNRGLSTTLLSGRKGLCIAFTCPIELLMGK